LNLPPTPDIFNPQPPFDKLRAGPYGRLLLFLPPLEGKGDVHSPSTIFNQGALEAGVKKPPGNNAWG